VRLCSPMHICWVLEKGKIKATRVVLLNGKPHSLELGELPADGVNLSDLWEIESKLPHYKIGVLIGPGKLKRDFEAALAKVAKFIAGAAGKADEKR